MGPSLDKARTVTTTEQLTPDQNLGESNVGNKLLQKLGWKSGASLGRKEDSISSNTEVNSAKMMDKLDKLKQDWERIETIARKTN